MKNLRQQWQLSRVEPGDGSALRPYRGWQLLTRSLFALDLRDASGHGPVFEVDVRQAMDGTSRRPVRLYRDGAQIARSKLPATFPVPGGVVEAASGRYGFRRMHYVTEAGAEHLLRPHPMTPEGRRARFGRRFPRVSAAVGVAAVVVLVVAAVLGLMQGIDVITHSPAVAAQVGTFTTPVPLSVPARIVMGFAVALAMLERALTLKSRRLLP